TTRITLVDLSTGTQIGQTLTVPGESSYTFFNPDGTRAVLATTDSQNVTRVVVIGTTTALPVNPVLHITGSVPSLYYPAQWRGNDRLAMPTQNPGGGVTTTVIEV